MKKLSVFKIIQLSILAVIAYQRFFLLKPEVKQFVFSSSSATTLFFFNLDYFNMKFFVFILIDLSITIFIQPIFIICMGCISDPLSAYPALQVRDTR